VLEPAQCGSRIEGWKEMRTYINKKVEGRKIKMDGSFILQA
jgi:hypothetical protein